MKVKLFETFEKRGLLRIVDKEKLERYLKTKDKFDEFFGIPE